VDCFPWLLMRVSAHNAGVLLLTCMVSYTAMPAVTTPPGELMYMLICMQQTCDRSHPEEGV
jgi:hypothetical protein